jgi:hypothetical protein
VSCKALCQPDIGAKVQGEEVTAMKLAQLIEESSLDTQRAERLKSYFGEHAVEIARDPYRSLRGRSDAGNGSAALHLSFQILGTARPASHGESSSHYHGVLGPEEKKKPFLSNAELIASDNSDHFGQEDSQTSNMQFREKCCSFFDRVFPLRHA